MLIIKSGNIIETYESDFGESIPKDYEIIQRAFYNDWGCSPMLMGDLPKYPKGDHLGALWRDSCLLSSRMVDEGDTGNEIFSKLVDILHQDIF